MDKDLEWISILQSLLKRYSNDNDFQCLFNFEDRQALAQNFANWAARNKNNPQKTQSFDFICSWFERNVEWIGAPY